MIRFILLWSILSLGIYSWQYLLNWKDKTLCKNVTRRVAVAGGISGVIVAALYLLNNCSGV